MRIRKLFKGSLGGSLSKKLVVRRRSIAMAIGNDDEVMVVWCGGG